MCTVYKVFKNFPLLNFFFLLYIYIYFFFPYYNIEVKLATLVEGDPKAPFSIAIIPK